MITFLIIIEIIELALLGIITYLLIEPRLSKVTAKATIKPVEPTTRCQFCKEKLSGRITRSRDGYLCCERCAATVLNRPFNEQAG